MKTYIGAFSLALLTATAVDASECRMRNCSGTNDCKAALDEQRSCVRAADRVRQLENERRESAQRRRQQDQIDAMKRIEEANKRIGQVGTSKAVDPPNR
jgi:hypothetical protein